MSIRPDDRAYLAQVTAVNVDPATATGPANAGGQTLRIPSVDAILPYLRQPLRNIMVKQAGPNNQDSSWEVLPEVGDLGIVKFLNGNTDEPYWDGWLVQLKQPSFVGVGQAYRIKHKSGVILEMKEARLGLGAGLDDLKEEDGVVRKKDLVKVVTFIMNTLLVWLKTHTHPSAPPGPPSPPAQAATWLDKVEAEASDVARAK